MFLFSEIMGHEDIKEHLQMAIRGDKPFHAYIFHGEVGCGKAVSYTHLTLPTIVGV